MKKLVTLIVLILCNSAALATDTFTAFSTSGKTAEGIIWKQTTRVFNPGPTETEFQLGKASSKVVTIFGDFLQNNKGAQYLGASVCVAKPVGSVKTSLYLNYYVGLNNTPDKIKVTSCANQPIGKSTYVGWGFLFSKSENAKSYFEQGPQIGIKIKSYGLNLQVVSNNREKIVFNTSFSVQF